MKFVKKESWVVVFDVLGFKNLVKDAEQDLARHALFGKITELVEFSEKEADIAGFEFVLYADTLVFFAPDEKPLSYSHLLHLCKMIICKSIVIRLPLRGAISVGPTYEAKGYPVFVGPAMLEAHRYGDAQDWIGLIMAPSATRKIREAGLEPARHDFVRRGICLKEDSLLNDDVLAYRFQNGAANFESYLIRYLKEMMHFAPESAKGKYQRTIDFIKQHYRYLTEEDFKEINVHISTSDNEKPN